MGTVVFYFFVSMSRCNKNGDFSQFSISAWLSHNKINNILINKSRKSFSYVLKKESRETQLKGDTSIQMHSFEDGHKLARILVCLVFLCLMVQASK